MNHLKKEGLAMVLNSTIEKMLTYLEDSIAKIEKMDLTIDMIIGDEDIQDLVDRRMQKATETCIDIATHLTAVLKLPRQETAGSIFELLGREKIISPKLAKKMIGAVGLRNIIVHVYKEMDYRLAYINLNDKLTDLRQFAKEIYEFLQKQKL